MLTLAIPRVITDEEAMGMLSRAYSSLKDIHFHLTRKHIELKRRVKRLEEELSDINSRYFVYLLVFDFYMPW